MPNLTFVHQSFGTETEPERAKKVRRKLETEKAKVAALYVVPPAFADYYDTARHENGRDYIIRLPYKFRETPVLKPLPEPVAPEPAAAEPKAKPKAKKAA